MKAQINHIIRSSAIDGPGNRMVLFFQGCQLNCMYCHNPQTIGMCNLCGICADHCPTNSLKIVNQKIIHKASTCIKCDDCIKNCPSNSSPFYKDYSVEELIKEVLLIKDFISGITVSGGEAMLQSDFLCHFFSAIRRHDELKQLSLFVDSNGYAEKEQYKKLFPLVDSFMIDSKAAKKSSHQKITGKSNNRIIENLLFLNEQGKLYEVRTVLVPDYNNSEEEIQELKKIYQLLHPHVRKVIIRMRTHGVREIYSQLREPKEEEMEQVIKWIDDPDLIVL